MSDDMKPFPVCDIAGQAANNRLTVRGKKGRRKSPTFDQCTW